MKICMLIGFSFFLALMPFASGSEYSQPATRIVGVEKYTELSEDELKQNKGQIEVDLSFPNDERYPKKLNWFFNQMDYGLRAYFENGKSNLLRPKLSVGYEGSEPRMPKSNNRYVLLEKDLTGDQINELIYLVISLDGPFVAQEINIFRYFAPLNLGDVGDSRFWHLAGSANFGQWAGVANIQIEASSIVVRRRHDCAALTWAFSKFVSSEC